MALVDAIVILFLTGMVRVKLVRIIVFRHDIAWSHHLLILVSSGQISGQLMVNDGFDRLMRMQLVVEA